MKRTILTIMAIAVMTSLVFANGAKDKSRAEGPLTVRMLYPDNSSYPYRDNWLVIEEIKKATGVNFQLILVPDVTADYKTKLQIVQNSGDMPEICSRKDPVPTEDAMNGLYLPISDYLDQMPNLKAFLNTYDYTSDIDNLREKDGKFYTLPVRAKESRIVLHQWLARLDVFANNNIPLPKTLDDVYNAAVKLKKLYPDSYPIINRFGMGNIMMTLGFGFGTSAGWALQSHGFTYDDKSERFVFAPASEQYKNLLMYMNKLYKAGVLDPEFNTLDSTVYEERVTSGKTFILVDWIGNQVRYNAVGRKLEAGFDIEPIFPPTGPNGNYAIDRGPMYEHWWGIAASVKDNPRFKEILKFIDWFYSDEAATITTFGKEGTSFVKKDGKMYYTDYLNNTGKDPSKEYGIINNALTVRMHRDWFGAVNGSAISDLVATQSKIVLPPEPRVRYSEKDIEDMKLLVPALSDYFNTMQSNFIYGKTSFAEWDNYVAECRKRGADKLDVLINNAYKSGK